MSIVRGPEHSLCCRSWRVFAPGSWCRYGCVWLGGAFLMLWQYGFSYTWTRTTTCPLAHRKTRAGSRPSIQCRLHSVRTAAYQLKNIENIVKTDSRAGSLKPFYNEYCSVFQEFPHRTGRQERTRFITQLWFCLLGFFISTFSWLVHKQRGYKPIDIKRQCK